MIDGIVTAIVRPPRAKYSTLDLGPTRIRHRGIEYKRDDFNLTNVRGLKLSGSVWSLMNPKLGNPECCILYLHPNSGSRVDVVRTRIMSIAANAKCTVCGFDFAGCGESEGDCVTLGVREKEDVSTVMAYLFSRGCTKFVLWGRSMGAATAAMFYGAYKELLVGTVVALILDSPFTSMQGLATEYTTSRVAVPGLLLSPAVHYLRRSIQAQYGFDILHISPVAASARINIPTIVLSGSEDKIVPPALSEELYDALGGPKMRIFFRGGHNTHRPAAIYEAVRVVLVGALRGLSSNEILRMSADVLKNEVIGVDKSDEPTTRSPVPPPTPPPTKVTHGARPAGGAEKRKATDTESASSDRQNSVLRAELRAEETERALTDLLKKKSVSDITTEDVSVTIGEAAQKKTDEFQEVADNSGGKKVPPSASDSSATRKGVEENIGQTKTNGSACLKAPLAARSASGGVAKSSADAVGKRLTESRASVHSISLDFGPQIGLSGSGLKDSTIPAEGTWMGALGSMLWGAEEASVASQAPSHVTGGGQFDGAPAGSLGYVLHHKSADICPPEASAWEDLLLARVCAEISDAVIEQVVTLVVGLVEAAEEGNFHPDGGSAGIFGGLIPDETPAEEKSLMLSMIIAELTSDMGLVSVDGRETIDWGTLVTSPVSDLVQIINSKRAKGIKPTKESDDSKSTQPGLDSDVTITTTVGTGRPSDTDSIRKIETAKLPPNTCVASGGASDQAKPTN